MAADGATTRTPTGTVTFLFTDIEGSTPLWDSHPDTMGASLARHDELVRSAIDDAGGHIFSTGGDGYGAVFARAADAVDAALAAQRSLGVEDWGENPALRVRMGLHTGEAEERDGDYFGPAVNRTARIMAAANGGQVVASALTVGVIGDVKEVKLFDLGSVTLKGVVDPVQVFGVAGVGHEWIDRPLLTSQVSAGNLPRLQTDFVGDLADLQRRVENLPNARVVTLTGSGGVGKTRAATEIGWLVVDEFVDGVWMSELAPITDPDLVVSTIASTLGAQPSPGMTITDSIIDWCHGRRMLLIVDNCEHVIDAVVDLVRTVVAQCPTVTIIATSREPLGVAGEIVVRIPSLEPTFGIELFTMRATAADSAFEPTPDDLAAIEAICDRLDGIPLAIELAAARTRSLSPTELLERLDDRFRLLRGGGRGGLERHQTLRATVAWSYQLLSAETQLLFDRLSVFSGTFDLAAAEAICAGDGVDEYDIVDLVADLVDKSMVITARSGNSTRYRLLETLRQYGEERLDDRADTAHRRDLHKAHYTGVARQLGDAWYTARQPEVAVRFDQEWDNLIAAHNWALVGGNLDDAISIVFEMGGPAIAWFRRDHQELAERTDAVCRREGVPCAPVAAQVSIWAFAEGDRSRAVETAGRAVGEATGDDEPYARGALVLALIGAGQTAEALAQLPRLREMVDSGITDRQKSLLFSAMAHALMGADDWETALEQFVAYAERLQTPSELFTARRLQAISTMLSDPPDFDGALARCHEAIEYARAIGASPSYAETTMTWAKAEGGYPDAIVTMRRVLAASYEARNGVSTALLLEQLPLVLTDGSADVRSTVVGYIEQYPPSWGALGEMYRAMHLAAEGPEPSPARQAGAAMDRHQIVAFALAALDDLIAAQADQTVDAS